MTEWRIEPLGPGHSRSDFACGIPSLDDFIRLRATQYQRRRLGKTFVAVTRGRARVDGYYTIAASALAFASLPPELGRKLPRHPVPALLIARLAVAQTHQGQHLGETLLLDALQRAAGLSDQLGIHLVEVDAVDDRAAAFYRNYGFTPLDDQPHRLLLPVDTILSAGPPAEEPRVGAGGVAMSAPGVAHPNPTDEP